MVTAAAPWDDACPREAMGSHSWVELGQDLSVFLLVPFMPCSDLNILSTSHIYLDQKKNTIKMPRRLSRQLLY